MQGFGTKWICFPDGNGVAHKIDLTYNMSDLAPHSRSQKPIKLFLYTRQVNSRVI
jgi:hypothetical protein